MSNEMDNERLNRSLMENIVLGIAHELNNPNSFVRLNAMTLKKMLGMIGRCLDAYEAAQPGEKFGPYTLSELRSKMVQLTEGILDASMRIIAVADKLKQCSSFSLTEATPLSIVTVLENVINMHRFLLDKWARVDFKRDEGANYGFEGFSLQLEQAFSILLTNACDAISERYPNPDDKRGVVAIELIAEDGHLAVKFRDNGTGMDEATMKKIFQPFFTTKPQGVGDGLGLPLCLGILERHGGRLEVESRKNEGSVFTVTLPRKQPRAGAA